MAVSETVSSVNAPKYNEWCHKAGYTHAHTHRENHKEKIAFTIFFNIQKIKLLILFSRRYVVTKEIF